MAHAQVIFAFLCYKCTYSNVNLRLLPNSLLPLTLAAAVEYFLPKCRKKNVCFSPPYQLKQEVLNKNTGIKVLA